MPLHRAGSRGGHEPWSARVEGWSRGNKYNTIDSQKGQAKKTKYPAGYERIWRKNMDIYFYTRMNMINNSVDMKESA
jgi:hypothetical protein